MGHSTRIQVQHPLQVDKGDTSQDNPKKSVSENHKNQGKSTRGHEFPFLTCHLGRTPHFQKTHGPASSILFLLESMLAIPSFDGPLT